MKIVLIRHGETDYNKDRLIQGRSNILLNDKGRFQVKQLREKLKDIPIDVCYMSPLVRTVETAFLLVGDKVEMIPDRRLLERDFGELEGKSVDEYDGVKFWDYNLNYNKYHVEPIQDVFQRCRSLIDYLLEKYNDNTTILIVSHGAVIRALHHILLNSDLNKDLLRFPVSNCYFEEIDIKK